jgi:hypothetical protein
MSESANFLPSGMRPEVCFDCDGDGCSFCICAKCHVSIWPRCSNPDPCIGYLPGVYNACCGHGKSKDAYICFGLDEDHTFGYASGKEAIGVMIAMRTALGTTNDERWHGGHD